MGEKRSRNFASHSNKKHTIMENEKDTKPPQPQPEPASDGVPHLYGANIAASPASESLFDLARGA